MFVVCTVKVTLGKMLMVGILILKLDSEGKDIQRSLFVTFCGMKNEIMKVG